MKRKTMGVKKVGMTLLLLFIAFIVSGATLKWVKVGSYWSKVIDSANEGESAPGRYFMYYHFNEFVESQAHALGWYLGARDWTDQNGNVRAAKISGAAHGTANEQENTMPIPDANGIAIRRYFRYQPPVITVDGLQTSDEWPLVGDEVNPNVIPGTADVMVESTINTSIGVTVHQRVLAWSQKYHDDYMIHDWTLENTGNVDRDPEIELPNQVLNGFHFMRINFWVHWPDRTLDNWVSTYGEREADSLRMMWAYPSRNNQASFDNTGFVDLSTGFIANPMHMGEAWLHVDTSPGDPTDDKNQPSTTGVHHIDNSWSKVESHSLGPAENQIMYNVMSQGMITFDEEAAEQSGPGIKPGHHSERFDERGRKYAKDFTWFTWLAGAHMGAGPWTLQPGESVRVVTARVMGSISVEKAWEVGQAWQDGSLTWNGPNKLPPPYIAFPDLMNTPADEAKNQWVFSGKDSLFMNANAAQWNFNNGYNVPTGPPPPAWVKITSGPGAINLEWDGTQPQSASDFVGYRVYRATGNPDPTVNDNGELLGVWERIAETTETNFSDTDAVRGVATYYYVTAFDDGINNIDVDGVDRGVLESGKYLTRSTVPARAQRVPGTSLSDVRVVPNPFNINSEIQFPGEENQLSFYDIPGQCTIKIYTVRGDLVETIEHTDGSGDETWGGALSEQHMTTSSGQIVASGLYIALIEDITTGENTIVKFAIVR